MQSACWNVTYAISTVKSLVLYIMKIVLFSALVACDNELLVFYSAFWVSIEVVYLKCCYFVVVKCDISLKALS